MSGSAAAAGQQIYSGAYNYAIGQGSTPSNATSFANTMLGVASGEGLYRSNPWGGNADAGGYSVGPFQLYSGPGGGLGSQYGITAGSSPQDQMHAAFSTAYDPNGRFNLQPWNAVGDTLGTGPTGNNTTIGRQTAEGIGSHIASINGLDGNQIANGPDQTFTDSTGRTYSYTTDPNAPPSQFDTTGMVGGGTDITDGSAGGAGFTQAGSGVASGAGAGAASTGSGVPASAGATSSSGSSSGGEGKATAVVGVSNTFFGDLNTWISQTLQRFGAAFQTALGASENSIATFFGGIANWFTRGFLIILGAVLIILAIIAMTGRSVTQVVAKGA